MPWGRIEDGESPLAAALRETWEEGGVRAEVEGLLGVQELPGPPDGSFALVYLCRHVGGNPMPQDRETDAAAYFSQLEFEAMTEPLEPWSAWFSRRVFAGKLTVTRADHTNPLHLRGTFL